MIVDSSAIVAIFRQESGFEAVRAKLTGSGSKGIGAPTLTETGIVLTARLGRNVVGPLARFIEEFEIVPVAFGVDHWKLAVDAFDRYGRGRHPAALNLGDCMTYAVAKLADEPLLCVGDDFVQTDLRIA